MTGSSIDSTQFRRILSRNVAMPLGMGVLSALVFVGIIAYLINVLNWVEHSERVIGRANEVSRMSADMEAGMRGYLLSGDDGFMAPYLEAKPKIDAELNALAKMVEDNPTQADRVRRIRLAQQEWETYAEEAIAKRTKNVDVVELVKSGRGKILTDEVRRLFARFIESEENLLQERNSSSRTVIGWSVGAFLLFSLTVAGLLALFGRRELMGLSSAYGEVLAHEAEHNALLRHQDWLRTGQAELATKSANLHELQPLADAVLDYVTPYLGGVVAAMYARSDDGTLTRIGAYGFAHQDQHARVIQPKESLAAQAANQNRILTLRELPPDYIKVGSGLGETSPRELLIAPISNHGKIKGVIEIGFLHGVRERDTEFMALIGPAVGASVASVVYRQRLQLALEEQQAMNEELQVQQEELRTANEELEEQSRALEESQTALENQQAELEQTNEQLAEQAANLDLKNTALTTAQDQLRERALELERASRYKSEFLANMSHELRTPLNSSLILAKLLADNAAGNLNDEQVRFAQTIYSAGNDLLNLINDILDISKVEAGKLELVPEELPLRRVIEGLARTFEPLAHQKNLEFSLTVEPSVPMAIHTDRQRLEQILKNLLSNAVKFTAAGRVSLTVSANAEGWVQFEVQDSGIGIAPEQQDKIFDAFHQADGSTARKYGGTGLGLSISRDLTSLLGGTLTVASTLGEGSTFMLSLPRNGAVAATPPAPQLVHAAKPVRAPAAPALPAAEAAPVAQPAGPRFDDDRAEPALGRRTALVIEDEPEFARILYGLAHDMEFRCLVALTAEEGLELAAGENPDAILLDMRLPDRSGLSVLQQLKDNPATRHIPVHVVSSQENGGEALHLGAIGYALKPTSREQLEDVFRKLKEKSSQQVKRVLLVEDDERQRESVVRLIADSDVEIAAVGSGEEALKLLRTQIFDCMIIDLKLPDMQGNELLQAMSLEELCSFPPVIVYTGRNLTREEEAELLKYSRSIIIKGARSPERLLDEVTLFLHKVESQLSSERQTMLKSVRGRDRVFEGRTILLVDDDVRNVFALTSALEQRGAHVEVGRNGFEALAKLDEVESIDLVLMDVMMPGMDGLEATRRIRQDARFTRLPIIAITAKAMKDDQEQCLAAGANDYLAKPIDLTRLYSLLRVWMPTMERI
ncbi:chemotaxis protein CheY [Massilia sp. WF1]|uniref:response regulator n=1 Tax=unclassified Massilia TaxID=2609279 RepID=UPI00064A6945|nr:MULTISPECIES: response regulator [unclassified Massilia]ALK98339.1 two-component system sensor histidine kinase/response regulator [Massilia sp. WG5]KLU37083.1 chemotaxis protein CheY [Massilia sp. WF1]